MNDGVVVLPIAGEEHADACLSAKIFAAELVKLCDGGAGVVELSQFQIGFGQQVEILRLARVFFDLLTEFSEIELSALLHGKVCAVVEIVEKMLIGIGSGRSVFRERLENSEIALRGVKLFQGTLNHRQF